MAKYLTAFFGFRFESFLDRQDMGPFRPHSGLTELWQWTEMVWLVWQRGASFMKIHDLNPPCMLRFNALHGRLEEKLPAIMSQRTLEKLDSIHLLSVFKYGSWRKTGKCTCNVLGVHAVLPCKDRCILLAGRYTMLQHWDSPTSPLLRPCAQEILRDVFRSSNSCPQSASEQGAEIRFWKCQVSETPPKRGWQALIANNPEKDHLTICRHTHTHWRSSFRQK